MFARGHPWVPTIGDRTLYHGQTVDENGRFRETTTGAVYWAPLSDDAQNANGYLNAMSANRLDRTLISACVAKLNGSTRISTPTHEAMIISDHFPRITCPGGTWVELIARRPLTRPNVSSSCLRRFWIDLPVGFAVLVLSLLAGEQIKIWLHLHIPGNVLGLFVLLLCFRLRLIPTQLIEEAANRLLYILPALFIPVFVSASAAGQLWSKRGLGPLADPICCSRGSVDVCRPSRPTPVAPVVSR